MRVLDPDQLKGNNTIEIIDYQMLPALPRQPNRGPWFALRPPTGAPIVRASRTLNRGAGERSFPIGDSLNVRVPGRGGSKGERPRRGPGGQALAASSSRSLQPCVFPRAFYSADSYTATFDGSRFASGVYFVRFTSTPQDGSKQINQTMKMLMVKKLSKLV